MEQESFVACPYDPKHRVPRLRIQGHIAKCQQKYPSLAICPYNATHRFPQEEIQSHVRVCPSKASIFPEDKPPKVIAALTKPKRIFQKDYLPKTDPNHEMWDD